jgi:SAM-dependent methyltransferase
MGLGVNALDAIGREHAYRPMAGDVVFIGRQTVYCTPDELVAHLRGHGHAVDRAAIEVDRATVNRAGGYAGKTLVTERSIFRALGIDNVKALDVSPYEGADMIHDLNQPLPARLEETVDFLIDGSTLDNVFDPAMALRNFARLLRPGGRLLAINAYSTQETAYTICSPGWFLDYFVENGFADCKIYVTVESRGRLNTFWLDPGYVESARDIPLPFHTNARMWITVFAEKGTASTTDAIPIQQHYRPHDAWDAYLKRLRDIRASPRPHLNRSYADLFLNRAFAGFVWMDREFRPRRHWREVPHRAYWRLRRALTS